MACLRSKAAFRRGLRDVSALFVSGSGTGVGKTHVAERLIREWREAGESVGALKPVISGFDPRGPERSDTGRLLAALGESVSQENVARVSPWRYAAPLSPDMAAAREGRAVPYDEIVSFCREAVRAAAGARRLLIEGVGGVMAPLDEARTMRDLIAAVDVPVVLVGGSYLGGLSHMLTAVEAVRAFGVPVERIVISETPESAVGLAESCAVLRRLADPIPVEALPFTVPSR